jgi:hypothetical protein
VKLLLACWLTAIAVLVWLAMPRPSTFEKRSPIELPSAMSWDTITNARKAVRRSCRCVSGRNAD